MRKPITLREMAANFTLIRHMKYILDQPVDHSAHEYGPNGYQLLKDGR